MVARYAIGRILTRTLQKANMRLTNSSTMPQLWYEYVLNSFLTAIAHLRGQKTKIRKKTPISVSGRGTGFSLSELGGKRVGGLGF